VSEVKVEVHSRGDAIRIALIGEVDLSNADETESAVVSAISNHTSEVDLDLSDVGYLDSAGLRVVYSLALRLRRAQIGLRITAPLESPARRAIEVSGMTTIAALEPSATD
jgi:stage II sporulation protein AA (anti-sigma F factor antagonist)